MLFKRKRIERADMVGAARSGALVSCASVETSEEGAPALTRLFTQHAERQSDLIHVLQREWSRRVPATALVLDRGQYSLVATEAPDVPREEWAEALRWQLADLVEYPVDDAVLQLLAVPESTQLRASNASIVLMCSQQQALQMDTEAADEGMAWSAVEVPETALRNICALGEEEGKAHALMVFGEHYSVLVVTFQGELLMARTIEVALSSDTQDEAARSAAIGRAGLEILRTLDTFERIHSQVVLAHVTVALPQGFEAAIEVLRDLVYQPLKSLDLSAQLDLSRLSEQGERVAKAATFNELCAIGAALRPWAERRGVVQISMQLAQGALAEPSWGLEKAATWAGSLVAVAVAVSVGLHLWGLRQQRLADELEKSVASLGGTSTAPGTAPRPRILVELEELRESEQRQRAVKDALTRMSTESVGSYSGYLKALSRQSQGSLWITGLTVQPNGLDVELRGRMTDPRHLPVYLEHLASEQLFRGRRFAQMEIKSLAASEQTAYATLSEFTLRARANGAQATEAKADGAMDKGGAQP